MAFHHSTCGVIRWADAELNADDFPLKNVYDHSCDVGLTTLVAQVLTAFT